jgi:hypothetical protein
VLGAQDPGPVRGDLLLLPGLAYPGCGTVTFAGPPPGLHAGSVSYGPVLNAAAPGAAEATRT